MQQDGIPTKTASKEYRCFYYEVKKTLQHFVRQYGKRTKQTVD
jgi:hypothetical protein